MTKAALVLKVAGSAAELLAADDLRRQWGWPSALHGYDVGGLAGHLARAVLTLESYLDAAKPSAEPDGTDAAGYYLSGAPPRRRPGPVRRSGGCSPAPRPLFRRRGVTAA